jgi:protein-tyrosine-phosphatase
MAEALTRKALAAKGIEAYVESAGTQAERGVSQLAVEAMARRQLDIAGHEAQPIQPEIVDRFDLILCMENHHRSAVMTLAPHAENKVFSLRDFLSRAKQAPPKVGQSLPEYVGAVSAIPAGKPAGIRDPLPEGTEEAYEATANQLDALLEELASLVVVLRST